MADVSINMLPVSDGLTDDGLLVVYQNQQAQSIRGELIKDFAKEGVEVYVESARDAAKAAEQGAQRAEAAVVNVPKVVGTTWWVYDKSVGAYVDTGVEAQGPVGPKGETGARGPQGSTGATGPQGPRGETGPQGIQGPKGDTGPAGPQGPVGETGPQGATGVQGPRGIQGEVGPQGPQGEVGPAGPQGIQGPEGPRGFSGVAVQTSGYVAFNVTEDGILQCSYTGDVQPNYYINENGHLCFDI